MAITIGVIVATLIVSLSVIGLLCLKGCNIQNTGAVLKVLIILKQVVKIEAQLSTPQPTRHMGR